MKRILEVDIIRPIAIILVLLTHCFAIYTGAWHVPSDSSIEFVLSFKIFTDFLQAFRMPAVVLVAGYVLGFQYERNKLNESFKQFVKKKVKRLLLPCFVFSVLYQMLFLNDFTISVKSCISLFSGNGHLWFLTMLFWNFVFGFSLLHKVKNKYVLKYLIIILFPISVFASFFPNIFGITRFMNYVTFFLYGILLWHERDRIVDNFLRIKFLTLIGIVFLVCFVLCEVFKYSYISELEQVPFLLAYIVSFIDYFIALVGVTLFYLIVLYFVEKLNYTPHRVYNYFSKRSYGLYVFHQFFLMFLVYDLKIDSWVDYRIAPFVMFILVLFSSLVLTNCVLKTKIGRFLIG